MRLANAHVGSALMARVGFRESDAQKTPVTVTLVILKVQ
jgi:hypothetical protein